jgi:hypothetical protein
MPKVEEPNDKVREQIEGILEQDEKRPVGPIRMARPGAPRKARTRRSGVPIWYPTPEKLILLGLAMFVIAAVIRNFVLPLTLGGFVLAGVGYYMLVIRRRRASSGSASVGGLQSEWYWRGKPVNTSRPAKSARPVKKCDGNVLEFPDSLPKKSRSWFGKKR